MAAGKGIRMLPLTQNRPKPLIPIGNKPIIEHIFDALIENGIKNISVLVGYKKEMIIKKYKEYRGIKIDFVSQKDQLGTGHAALFAEKYDDDKILFINGDLFFSKDAIAEMLKHENGILGVFKEDASEYGYLVGDKFLSSIREKVKGAKNRWINGGIYLFNRKIFNYLHKIKKSPRGELEFTDAINMMVKEEKVDIVKFSGDWVDVGRPWDLLRANKMYLDEIETRISGELERDVVIKGKVIIGRGTVVKSGTYIEGPVIIGKNCKIGPNAYIRPYSTIGDNCHVGISEVKESIIMNNSNLPHFNYVGDSVIGENCNLGAGTKIANLRLDGQNVKIRIGNMGDDVKTGINVSINVGTLIASNKFILPESFVSGVIK